MRGSATEDAIERSGTQWCTAVQCRWYATTCGSMRPYMVMCRRMREHAVVPVSYTHLRAHETSAHL
eukprot:1618719-Alexandrium_andersonii.AAC.1